MTDPISKFIPEFKNPKVIQIDPDTKEEKLVPARREITIRHLLNHTSGITYGDGPQAKYYEKAGMTVGLTPTARKAASGAAERLPFIQVTNLARTLADLKSRHIWVVGAAGGGLVSLYESDFAAEPVALVMGSEGEGLRRLTQESCDQLIYIPMRAPVESLNVSVAAAVCLFEFRRVRDQAVIQAGALPQ